jgi:hypothetical protein
MAAGAAAVVMGAAAVVVGAATVVAGAAVRVAGTAAGAPAAAIRAGAPMRSDAARAARERARKAPALRFMLDSRTARLRLF